MDALILQAVVSGVILGAVYGMVGASLTVLYGVMRIANLAHGEFIILGCYISYLLFEYAGIHPAVAIPASFVCIALFATMIYRGIVMKVQNSADPEMASFLAFFGLSLMIGAILLQLFGADARSLNFSFKPIAYRIDTVVLPTSRLFVLAIEFLVLCLLAYILFFTLPGKALRAAIMNRDALRYIGINVDRLSMFSFAFSIGLAGATGVLLALVFPAFGPFSGLEYTIIGFISIVIGGLGNPVGALVGGLIFGLTQQITSVFIGQSYGLVTGFVFLLAVLTLRPQGLLGSKSFGS